VYLLTNGYFLKAYTQLTEQHLF